MNVLEVGLAFLEGLGLIASPCILPVLPIVLCASVDGDNKRPLGIILGFVISFSLFVVASRKLVAALDIDLNIIKNVSLIVLFAFGLILLSERLSEIFSRITQKMPSLGAKLSTQNEGGLISGLIIGSLIGLIWTPCAGPILAAVLVQVIRQQTDVASLMIIVAFALGAGTPMLVIALGGRKVMSKLTFFTIHALLVRRTLGVIIMLAVAAFAFGTNVQSLVATNMNIQSNETALALEDELSSPYAAPRFSGIDAWINSAPLTMNELRGKVVLIDFWTYSCINCIRTLPYLTEWDKKYRNQGLVIIGVHAPEFEFEKKLANVQAAATQYGIKYPIALDNNLDTWINFNNHYWPAHYLIDKNGMVVYTHFGEASYDITENNIRYLLEKQDSH